MKDFTRQAKVVEFKIDDDTFRGRPHLPAQTMIDFTVAVEAIDEKNASPEQGFDTMMGSLKMVLMPDSYKRFRERMNDPAAHVETADEIVSRVLGRLGELGDGDVISVGDVRSLLAPVRTETPDAAGVDYVPIELDQLPDILDWLMGEYGMRPTQSSADSSDGQSSPASGTNSTESTSVVELTSVNSPSIGS